MLVYDKPIKIKTELIYEIRIRFILKSETIENTKLSSQSRES
jgi:hypothetical protein